jgi:hypothetical protein
MLRLGLSVSTGATDIRRGLSLVEGALSAWLTPGALKVSAVISPLVADQAGGAAGSGGSGLSRKKALTIALKGS